ncbi:MAG: L-serine dehydratase [Clostridia bacterium]|nr:L-serine dehydratase [Clostridia bacterium]MDN5321792.1 L-serine dehydratase [Clostridia bacterium]
MREYSCFDILGPIMVGPSSSHTAGAVRLGRLARSIIGGLPEEVEILLHGSFAQTYRGHGTDLALIGGLLGFNTNDVRIRDSFSFAQSVGLKFRFISTDLGDGFHPNTVKFIVFTKNQEKLTITGSSIGGGNVVITEINGYEIKLKGDLPTIITTHQDVPGVISRVSGVLANYKINIAFMRVFRKEKRKLAQMIVETDEQVPQEIIEEILKLEPIVNVRFIEPA